MSHEEITTEEVITEQVVDNHQEASEAEAQGAHEISHEVTIFAEPIFHIGSFTVTNSLINSFVAVLILCVVLIAAGRNMKRVPRGIQNFFEMILEGALSFADSITGERRKSERFMPIVLSLFLFILVNNWLGLFPFVGTVGFVESEHGKQVLVPFLRGATADLNTTLALALFAIVGSHFVGVMSVGVWKHVNKFINVGAFLSIPKEFSRDKTVAIVNPIKAVVGVIEIVGELARIASLSFRLFGNIFAGEVLLASMMALVAFLVPLPFMFLEVLVGLIQASVFAILTLVFFTMMSTAEEH